MRIRNIKNKVNFFTIKSAVLMVAICVVAVFYIRQHVTIIQLGYKIKKDELKFERLLDDKARMELVISRLESPKNINKLLAMANIDLSLRKNPKVVIIRS